MEQCDKKMTFPDWGSGCYKVHTPERAELDVHVKRWLICGLLCLQVLCSNQGLAVYVEERPFPCLYPGQLISVSVRLSGWVYNGVLVCPACSDLCDLCPEQAAPHNTTRSTPLGQ